MVQNSILSTAVSGLNANSRRVQTVANNIANINTPGFRSQSVETSTIISGSNIASGSGVQVQILTSENPVNLTLEISRLIQAEAAYKSNAKVLQTADELNKETLNLLT